MNRSIIVVLVVALLGGSAIFALSRPGTTATMQEATAVPTTITPTSPARARITGDQVVVDGKLVPVNSVALTFPTRNIVTEVLVQEGNQVEKGAPLARPDTRELELNVAQARATLDQAKAQYDQLMAGATPEEIAITKAQLDLAQARLREVNGSVTGQDIAAVEAQRDQAQLGASAGPAAIAAAQADLDQAKANLQAQRDSLSAAKTRAQSQMEQAANALRDRQAEYSSIYWDNQRELSDADPVQAQERKDLEEAALRAVQNAEHDLAQARLAYEQAAQAEITGIARAEAAVRNAQAKLNALRATTAAEQAAARAQAQQAEADLARLTGEQRAGGVDAASAEVTTAQANLDMLTAAPPPTQIASAVAQVQLAEVALKQAELALDQAALRAPIAGTVVKVDLRAGEVPSQTQPAFVLADFSSWQIETAGLNELGVVHIREGDPAIVTFYAMPGVELPGTVSRIRGIGESGDEQSVVYTAVITLDRPDERLRWNMTASVTITPAK